MAVTNTTALAADLQTYFSKKLLKQASYKTVLDQFAHVENIPANSSKTISFTQYADLAVATTPLTEGTAPTDTALSSSAITATVDQLGAFVTLTDLAELTVKHPVIQKTTELLSVQAARSYDRTINSVVVAGTSVYYAGTGNAARADIAVGDVLTFSDIRKAVALLRNNGASEFADGNFVLVIDPSVEADLMGDTTFQNTVQRNNLGTGGENYKGTITKFAGVTVVRSNNIPTLSSTTTVHASYLFGQNAFAVSDLQNLQMYKEGPGGVSDPLNQKMTMGWKLAFKSVILNNNFMVRLEAASNY
jgi:N4-gp56 family major capsid protein